MADLFGGDEADGAHTVPLDRSVGISGTTPAGRLAPAEDELKVREHEPLTPCGGRLARGKTVETRGRPRGAAGARGVGRAGAARGNVVRRRLVSHGKIE